MFLIESDEIKDSKNSFEPPKLQLNTFSGAISWWQYDSFKNKNNEGHEISSVVIGWMCGPVQRAAPVGFHASGYTINCYPNQFHDWTILQKTKSPNQN